jgi:DNA-directed RNA polymerase subunit E"
LKNFGFLGFSKTFFTKKVLEMKKACKECKSIIVKGSVCPVCKSTDLTSSFQGTIVIFDPESEVAKHLGIKAPGRYAIKV